MILSDSQILEYIEQKDIVLEPFNRESLGSNSYDLHLSEHLAIYKDYVLDAKKNNTLSRFEIPEEGFVFKPGILYLGSTTEYTESHNCVPCIEGKSSCARLGVNIHITAGFGDAGFCGYWTLEISVIKPVRLYANMPIGQIYWFKTGICLNPYDKKKGAKYDMQGDLPVASRMYLNFNNETNKWK